MPSLPDDITQAPGYTRYLPLGTGTFAEWIERLLERLRWAVGSGVRHLLVDTTRLVSTTPGTTFERLRLGESGAAGAAASGIRIAFIGSEPFLDPERFGETVAVNRGLNVRVFTDEVAALTWLVGPNAIRPVLETERTRVRWLIPADAPFIQELVNQPSWLANIGDRNVHDRASAEGYIAKGPVASYAKHGFGLWCVERKEDGVPIGICGLLKRDYLDAPDIGYAFLERFQGRGYASEVTAATVAHAKEAFGLTRLLASVVPSNAGSIKVLERIGMRFLRSETLPGDSEPVALYGMTW
jgi:RimJ/RimL family protein N-acetyltransferase